MSWSEPLDGVRASAGMFESFWWRSGVVCACTGGGSRAAIAKTLADELGPGSGGHATKTGQLSPGGPAGRNRMRELEKGC
jgi:hypothetical protein